jgi:hypothetical protein
MRGMNLAVLIAGLLMVGAALYGFGGVDGSLKLAASHAAPQSPCPYEGEFTPGV